MSATEGCSVPPVASRRWRDPLRNSDTATVGRAAMASPGLSAETEWPLPLAADVPGVPGD